MATILIARHRLSTGWTSAALAVLLGPEQLDGDPQQKHAADQLEVGHLHQRRHHAGEHDAQADGDQRSEHDAPDALLGRKLAAGKRNDDGVVARQQNVDPDDL